MAIQFYNFLILLSILTWFGCTPTYSYNRQDYQTPGAALAAVKKDAMAKIETIVPRSMAINLSAKVVIPNLKRIIVSVVKRKGSPDIAQINYVAKVIYLGYRGMGIALAKRNIFARVDFKETFATETSRIEDYDILIWLQIDRKGRGTWYLQNKISPRKIVLDIDLATSGTDRLQAWLNGIEKHIEEIHSTLYRKTKIEKSIKLAVKTL